MIRPKNIIKDPKIQSKSNVRIDRNKENVSYSTTRVEPKTVFELFLNPKNSPLGPKKAKNDPKIKSKKMSELKKTKKMKVVQLHK